MMTILRVVVAVLGAVIITVVITWGSKELIADRLTEEGLRVLPLKETPDELTAIPVRSSDCADMESSVRLAITKSQSCAVDDDCEVISLGCPFGCATPVQSTSYVSIGSLNQAFQDRCAYCLAGCASDPPPAICSAGRCVLERFPSRPPLPSKQSDDG